MCRRVISTLLFLAVLYAMSIVVSADSSTTTYDYAAKDFSANTEIYAVTREAPDSYPYYGARFEPDNGVYYGRSTNPDWLSADTYGLTNGAAMKEETAFAYYYSLGDSHSLEEYSYMFSTLNGGDMVFLLNFNFEQEAADCRLILQGVYDAQLRDTFSYLATMDCPLMLRIGGEVNVWSDLPDAELFIYAYRYVAYIAWQYCPEIAMVYSPNYSSGYQVDMDSFYPGDDWVDWIGASLYYNRYANNGDTKRDAFYGVAAYGNPILNIQQIVNLSRLHNKPIIITEGGSFWYRDKENLTDFASENVEKAYAYLTMLYPEIKCLIYSDTNFGKKNPLYYIFDNTAMTAAYDAGVASNQMLLHSLTETAEYYTPLSEFTGTWTEDVTLNAYTCSNQHLVATWYVDGIPAAQVDEYPYPFTVHGGTMDTGTHYISVSFSNGASRTYMIQNLTLQPQDQTILAGEEAVFHTRALGNVASYTWQYSENGIVWHNINPEDCPSAETDTLSFQAYTWLSGRQYHCVVQFTDGAMITSDAASLTVSGISTQPKDTTVTSGDSVMLSIETQGNGSSYQWQYSENEGITWTDLNEFSAASLPNFTFQADADYDGYRYRCLVMFPSGQIVSEPMTLSVNGLSEQPSDAIAQEGEDVTMSVLASGHPRSYRWQYSLDGFHWNTVNTLDAPSAATSEYTFKASSANSGCFYRCLVIFEHGTSLFSEPARFSLDCFDEQPADLLVRAGSNALFAVKLHETPAACRWQYSADGSTWTDISTSACPSAATPELTFSATPGLNGYRYRCLVTYQDGEMASKAALLSVSG